MREILYEQPCRGWNGNKWRYAYIPPPPCYKLTCIWYSTRHIIQRAKLRLCVCHSQASKWKKIHLIFHIHIFLYRIYHHFVSKQICTWIICLISTLSSPKLLTMRQTKATEYTYPSRFEIPLNHRRDTNWIGHFELEMRLIGSESLESCSSVRKDDDADEQKRDFLMKVGLSEYLGYQKLNIQLLKLFM